MPAASLRLAGEHVAGFDLLAVGDFDTRLGGQVVEVEDLAVGAFDGDTRMAFTLVLDDDELGFATAALALFFQAGGFAFFDVFVADDTALLGQDRGDVRIPDDQLLARLHLLAVGDEDGRTVRNLVLLDLAALGVDDDDFAVALQGDQLLDAFGVGDLHRIDVAVLDGAAGDGLDVVFDQAAGGDATGVEGTHGELRARLTDRLSGDDADGQAFFDDLVGGHVDAVAAGADAARAFAGERRANADGFELQFLELVGDLVGDDLVFGDDGFVGDRDCGSCRGRFGRRSCPSIRLRRFHLCRSWSW